MEREPISSGSELKLLLATHTHNARVSALAGPSLHHARYVLAECEFAKVSELGNVTRDDRELVLE